MIIRELILFTDKADELKRFYSDTLKLDISDECESGFTIQTPSTLLTFKQYSFRGQPFYHFAFNIPENQIKQAGEWLRSRTKLISLNGEEEFDFKSWNANSVYFYDPAGNIVELIARHNLKNASSENFSGNSFLSVSEIGLPVHDVEKFYNEIKNAAGIPVFSGDNKTFCAAGDDEGLFIIVNENRKWYPDCPEAKIFPAIIKINSFVSAGSNRSKEIIFDDLPYKIILTE